MASARHVVLLTLAALMSVTIANAARLSAYNKESFGAIDDLIVKAADSSREFRAMSSEESNVIQREYDILMTDEQSQKMYHPSEEYRQRRGAAIHDDTLRRWTNNTVNYEIKWSQFRDEDIPIIKEAIADWEGYTCVKFKHSDTAKNRLIIQDGGGCSSYVGMLGNTQPLTLSEGCRWKRIVLHELGHAMGFQHEQTRPDRDEYIDIDFKNIQKGVAYNFDKYKWGYIQDLGVPYDYKSIMHYSKTAFANGGGETIRTKDTNYEEVIGRTMDLSFGDIKSMNLMYKCNAACGIRKRPCPFNGFVGKDCRCWCQDAGTTARYCYGWDRENLGPIVRENTANKLCEDTTYKCEEWGKRHLCDTLLDYVPYKCPKTCDRCWK